MSNDVYMALTEGSSAYSAADMWMNMTQGLIGSVISIVGIFIAFLLTRNHDRSLQKKEHDRDATKQRIQSTAECAAQVSQVALVLRTGENTDDTAKHCLRLADEITLLGISLAHHYPSLLDWSHRESKSLISIAEQYNKATSGRTLEKRISEAYAGSASITDLSEVDSATIAKELSSVVMSEEIVLALKAASWESGMIVSLLGQWAKREFDVAFTWPKSHDMPKKNTLGGRPRKNRAVPRS